MKKLPPETVIKEANAIFSAAQMQRADIEDDYVSAVNLEAGVIDGFEEKSEGQSAVVLPDYINHLRGVAAVITNALKSDPDFPILSVRSNDEDKRLLGDILTKIIRHELIVSGFYQKLKAGIYMSGLAGYCPVRIKWASNKKYLRRLGKYDSVDIGRVDVEPFNPMDFWYDPSGFNRLHIVRRVMTLDGLMRYAERDDQTINKAAIAEILKNEMPELPYTFEIERSNMGTNERQSEDVEILEICGEWHTSSGDLITENGSTFIANRKHIIKQPTEYDNPWAGSPYQVIVPVADGMSGYPVAFAKPYMPMLVSLSELWNLTVDIAREGLPINTFIGSAFDNPELLADGIAPGSNYSTQAPGDQILHRIHTGANPQAAMAVFSLAMQLTQGLNAGIIQAGLPSARGRQTATEVMYAQQQASSVVADLMDGIASSFLQPMIQRMMYLLFDNRQKEDWLDADIEWVIGKDNVARLAKSTAFEELYDAVSMAVINVDEPAKSFRRQSTLESLTGLLKNLANILPGWFDVKAFAFDIIRMAGQDPTRYVMKEFSDEAFGNYLMQQGMGGAIIDKMKEQPNGQTGMPQNLNEGATAYNAPGPRNPGGMI